MEKKDSIAVTVWEGTRQQVIYLTPGDNLLMGLVRAKLPIDFFCTTGKCRTCALRMQIPEGSASGASATEQYRLGQDALGKGFRLACQVYVSGPLSVYLDASGSACTDRNL
ncbi:2Fe-2S iron-sulfur cluster-binding protein [Brevibacillus sp. NRS-1366]|uniref:2Fe-2S iron-sulfur cluster-binding protein n=1 Tax=Brevibacillus sp. NRS-1366 TaxID=3233899 RepID=UPI003D1E9149